MAYEEYIARAEEIADLLQRTNLALGLPGPDLEATDVQRQMATPEGARRILRSLSMAYSLMNDAESASSILLLLFAEVPADRGVAMDLANYHAFMGQLPKAIEVLDEHERVAGPSPQTRFRRAICHLDSGRPAECMELMLAVWEALEPGVAEWSDRARCHVELGQYKEALFIYDVLKDVAPASLKVWTHIALCQYEMGEYGQALQAFEEQLRLTGPDVYMLVEMGRIHIRLGEHIQAKGRLLEAYAMEPTVDSACYYLSILPQELFAANEIQPQQYFMRADHLNGFFARGSPGVFYEACKAFNLCMQLARRLERVSLPDLLLLSPETGALIRTATVYLDRFDLWSAGNDLRTTEAEAILRYLLADTGGCYRLIDDQLMAKVEKPSFRLHYYYALAADAILEDHESLVQAAANLITADPLVAASDPDECCFAALLLCRAGRPDDAKNMVARVLERDHAFVPAHLIALRIAFEVDGVDPEEAEGLQRLSEVGAVIAAIPGCYYRDPFPILLEATDEDPIATMMPALHYLEHVRMIGLLDAHEGKFRNGTPRPDPFDQRSGMLAGLITFGTEGKDQLAFDINTDRIARQSLDHISAQLYDGIILGELDAWVAAYQSVPEERRVATLGLEVYERVHLALTSQAGVHFADVVERIRRSYLVSCALLRADPGSLDRVLALHNYCRFALHALIEKGSGWIAEEIRSELEGKVLKVLQDVDVIGAALNFTLLTINPGYWVFSRTMSRVAKGVIERYYDEGFISFDRYVILLKNRTED